MKKIKSKILTLISSGIFMLAVQAANSISIYHTYQDKEPNSLKKFNKY